MEAFDLMFDDDDYLLELETEQQASITPPPPQATSNQSKDEYPNNKNQLDSRDPQAEHRDSAQGNSFK